ncbi:MAG: TrmB family transcriptional regulator sugar-binding domain-containing protein [Candidatus Odinarchaeota archaeon]
MNQNPAADPDPDADAVALLEFRQLLQQYKSANIPEANWKLHALLRRLGLTKYEIQAYIVLIESGEQEQTVTQIVKNTGIPHPRAYDTLRNLVKYGLITAKTRIKKPTSEKQRPSITYKAFEPAIGIGNLFAFFSYAKEEAIKELQKLAKSETRFESGIWEVHGKDNIVNITNLMIEQAKYEILLSIDLDFIHKIISSLNSASKRKVIITCVSNFEEGTDTILNFDRIKSLRMKHRQNFPMPYIILDRSRAIQWNFRTFHRPEASDPEFIQAQVIDKVDLIDTLIDHFFFSNWRLGKPVSIFNEVTLPGTFIHSVNFVEEIEKLMDKKITPKVVVRGCQPQTGKKTVKVGEVSRIYKNWESGVFTIYLKTDSGSEISVGGFGAIYEDIAADQVTIGL